ncbi:hypothetical protein SAY87_009871 [Trapa incisa]|uniref:Nuclear pore complex protein n=1 Tax=Trapa incisa TaxID=236973 RepID=A0AAN7JZ49_9MYRT|nr:hypothetical protein SAY87_009871 [Trapa incisa]
MASRDGSNPHGVSGAGGKFRSKPYRRPPTTPYDRPPAAIRNPSIVPGTVGHSWLRKLVDPAHKLLAATARGFFTSVLRKRLTHSPPTPQPLEAKDEAGEKHDAPISFNILKEQVVSDGNLSSGMGEGSSKDLEEILKHRSFTRSEVDRLVALLHDNAADNPAPGEEKGPNLQPSNADLSCGRREEAENIPLQEDEIHLMSSKAVNSSVFDEKAVSPVELAKAYMNSRPPSMLGLHSQSDLTGPSSLGCHSKSPILSSVPSSSGHVENSYAMPRSHGRSAIYSMARTPYTKVHVTSTPKSSEPITDGYDLPSSSIQAPEYYRSSESTKVLKRSSSIFENDMSSDGPFRMTRKKSNISYRRSWIMPVSESGDPSSSIHEIQPVSGRKSSFNEQSNVAAVSLNSTDMASKILEQLDTIVSPPKERSVELKLADVREKAPALLSPSKLKGQALKSLGHIDLSTIIEYGRDKPHHLEARYLHHSVDASEDKRDKIELNGTSSTFAASENSSLSVSGLGKTVTIGKFEDHPINSLARAPIQNGCAFKISAHEDFLDLEDDDYANGISSSIKGTEKQESSIVEVVPSAVQANVIPERLNTVTDDQSRRNVFTKETTCHGTDGNQVDVQKHTDVSFSTIPSSSTSFQSNMLVAQSSLSPDKVLTFKEPHAHNSEFTTSNADKSHEFDGSSSADLFSIKRNRVENSSRDEDEAEDRKHSRAGALSAIPDGSTVAFASTTPATSSNGSSVPTLTSKDPAIMASQKPFSTPSFPAAFGGNKSSSSLFSSISSVTESPALPIFGFGSSQSNSLFQAPSPTAMASEDAKTAEDMTSGNITAGSFVAAKSSLESSSFGFVPTSAPSNGNNKKEISAVTSAANESAQAPESTAVGLTNLTENIPIQSGSSSSSMSSAIKESSSASSYLCPSSPSTFGFVPTPAPSNGNNQKEISAITSAANESAEAPEFTAPGTGLANSTEDIPIQSGSSSSSMPSAIKESSSAYGYLCPSSPVTFGFVPTSAPSNGNNQKEISAIASAANESAQAPESTAPGTELAKLTDNIPIQSGSSSSSLPPAIKESSSASSYLCSSSPCTFGFVPISAPSNGNNQKEISAVTSAANESAQAPESTAPGTGLANLTENVPIQSGSSSSSMPSAFKESSSASSYLSPSSPSLFGQATTTSAFASSLTSKSPSMGFSFGSSTSSSSSSVFGSGPSFPSSVGSASKFGLSGASPAFGATSTSSAFTAATVFGSIGASSDSNGALVFGSFTASSASSPIFGSMGASSSSTPSFLEASAGPSSDPAFSFTSAAASPSPSSLLDGSSSSFAFGSSSPFINNNTEDMSMESSGSAFSFTSAAASPSPSLVFGGSSSPFSFGSPPPTINNNTEHMGMVSSGSAFSFTSAAANPSPSPVFGGSSSPFAFGSPTPIINNTEHMGMESDRERATSVPALANKRRKDSMTGDTFLAYNSSSSTPVFGQQPSPESAGFVFGSNICVGASPFQFGSQPNLLTPDNQSSFQASGSPDFSAGVGSFSLGSGGDDKSRRKIVRINRSKLRSRK